MNLIRKHKISLITNESLTGVDKEIVDFIQNILSNLTITKDITFANAIFYIKDGKVLLKHLFCNEKDVLYCSYYGVWYVLESKYNMKDDEIREFLKYMVEHSLKISVSTISFFGDVV